MNSPSTSTDAPASAAQLKLAGAPGARGSVGCGHRSREGREDSEGAKTRSWSQNIHLVARWLSALDKKLERYSAGSHEDYRVFISAEPAPSPESHIIPQGILENAIKITNEPPTGMYANLHKALDLFTQVRRLPLRGARPADREAAVAWSPGDTLRWFSPRQATPSMRTPTPPATRQYRPGRLSQMHTVQKAVKLQL